MDAMKGLEQGTTKTATEDEWLAQWMHQTMYVTVRGMISCVPHIRAEKVLMMFAHTTARLLCELYAGDELSVRRMRKNCDNLFSETLKKLPVTALDRAPTEASVAGVVDRE